MESVSFKAEESVPEALGVVDEVVSHGVEVNSSDAPTHIFQN